MITMLRNMILAPALVAAAALATTSAMATTLKVPFSFTAGGQECPAGDYSVDRGFNGNLVTLSNRDGSRNFSWLLSPGDPSPTDHRIVLKFEDRGQTHVLQAVQFGALQTRPLVKKTKRVEYPTTSITAGEGR